MKERSVRSCGQGILKLYKSGIYVVVLAEIEIKLVPRQDVKKN